MRRTVLLIWLVLAGCGNPTVPVGDLSEVALIPTTPNRAVDLLFVIDDSTNLLSTQLGFVDAFPAFVNELASLPGGLPDVHIGVVTSDLGTLGALDATPGPSIGSGPGGCSGIGKGGVLVTNGSTAVQGTFISDVANTDGTRITNYTGTLAEAFSQLAAVGSRGCGFEQHLEAAKRALDNNPANAGFLRPDATLAIIVLTDEDDCSFQHSSFLDPSDTMLGPLASFRCTRFGITCDDGGQDPDAMNQPGVKSKCHANEDSPYVVHLADFAAFFKGLKTDPRDVMVGTVSGDSQPFEVSLVQPPGGGTAQPRLGLACTALDGEDPSVRLPQLAHMFAHGATESVCTMDFHPAHADLARHVRNLVGDSCLPAPLPSHDCIAVDQGADGSETPLPACGTGDCYELVPDTACTGSGLRLSMHRSSPPPTGTMTSLRCVR